jgi:glucuronate isomerase
MSQELTKRLFDELDQLVLIDPHTHINPHAPASRDLGDLLGYHYYTELAHSAGLARERIEEPGISSKEKVARLFEKLETIDNTIQWSWFLELSRELLGFQGQQIDRSNWEAFYDDAQRQMAAPDWAAQVLHKSRLESVFLTNDFDDPLRGFDTSVYIPCLRTDDLVFHLAQVQVRQRLEKATGIDATTIGQLRSAIGKLFEHFKQHHARACAISLPPDFTPEPVSDATAESALLDLVQRNTDASPASIATMAKWTFWTLAEYCHEHSLPFDLMIGVRRKVYPTGVYQGQDLYDSRVSMIQYATLFNHFPKVVFPISVLASVTNQELVDFAWIFPNVYTSSHWWYSNTPSFIARDLAARLEAIPRTKQIGYYSDMYKLEFALPKFRMYKRILANILATEFVQGRQWTESQAIQLGRDVLRTNVERIFFS